MDNRPRNSIFWPLLLIVIGVFLFLNNFGRIEGGTWDLIINLWPTLLIVAGLDGLYRREGFVGAVLVIGLGVIFLLSNFNYLNVSPWDVVLRLWPIILVAIGLDLIIGHRSPWTPWVGIILGLVLTGGILWLALSAPGVAQNLTPATITVPNDGADMIEGNIDLAAGQIEITSSTETDTVLTGDIYIPESSDGIDEETIGRYLDYEIQNGTLSYSLNSPDYSSLVPFSSSFSQVQWSLGLTSEIPSEISIDMGAGDIDLDASDFTDAQFDIEMGAGIVHVILPNTGGVTLNIDMAVGNIVLLIPEDAAVRINLDTAVTVVNLPLDYERNEDIVTSPNQDNPIQINLGNAVGIVSIRTTP
ncbi:MAG TPA: DUF5668 domain-containing protein [Longilinea sp.]|nr:DUF5668 domain-containing protein [Longilinea sp.]